MRVCDLTMVVFRSISLLKCCVRSHLRTRLIAFRPFCSASESDDEVLVDDAYEKLVVPKHLRFTPGQENVLVIQPRAKFGTQKFELLKTTTPELQLQENVALARTLHNWNIVDQMIVPSQNINRKLIFGSGQLSDLAAKVRRCGATSVFLG